MVPPNWQHPKDDAGRHRPMHNKHIDRAMEEWLATFDRIRRGELDDIETRCYGDKERHPEGALAAWLNDCNIPNPEYLRPYRDEEATWFQVYETVSEGTPVTPPFATKAELVDWLVEKGESHGTQYCRRHSREAAEAFVEDGWVPSMVIAHRGDGTSRQTDGIDASLLLKRDTH